MRRSLVVVTFVLFAAACGDNKGTTGDAGVVDAPTSVDGGVEDPVAVEMTCATLPPSTRTCDVTAGSKAILIKGNILTSTVIYKGGQVLVDTSGKIACVGCNCAAGGETTLSCPTASVSPGLINTHDHITFTQNNPYTDTGVRYEDRQQWRIGLDKRPKIPSTGSAKKEQVQWGELRFAMGGATSIVGSGGAPGLLRNLDQAANQGDGFAHTAVDFDTFPLDDTSGTRRNGDCNYGGMATTPTKIAADKSYEPHTSEGIDTTARNEFLCQSRDDFDVKAPGLSYNLTLKKTSMIHAIGLTPADYGTMAAAGTSLIWSPRSNITLYGDTARVTAAARLGVKIALGTDWMPTGSMSLLRELACADSFNATYLDHYFTDQALWEMVTRHAAEITATDDAIGALAVGKIADISIFASHGKGAFRTVIEAQPTDVALVLRGGTALYGDDALVNAIDTTCDTVDVCGSPKRVCAKSETSLSYSELKAAAGDIYPAFACGVPDHEPTCTPSRPEAVAGSTIYTGMTSMLDSDGDGIDDTKDNCPKVFNPVRPMDGGVQGDADGDGVGDACDPCPLDKGTTTCTSVDPNDRDHDGVANAMDNCPDVPNPDQADADHDHRGDACDLCPADANPDGAGCPKTIYQIKSGMAAVGTQVAISNAMVTGRGSNGFFVQVKEGDMGYLGAANSGLFVFTSMAPAAEIVVGTRVSVDGSITNFQGQIELTGPTTVVTNATPAALPAPTATSYADIKTDGPQAAALESVIVSLGAARVSAVDATAVEFTLTDADANALVVDDFVFALPAPPLDQIVTSITGILALRQIASSMPSVSKLLPRSLADISLGAPSLKSLSPALAFARVGVTAGGPTFPDPLVVTLTNPAQGDTTVTLTSSDPASLTVTDVTIPNGMTVGVVNVTAVAQAASVTVTATLGTKSFTAAVRVLGAAETGTTVTLSPAAKSIHPGDTVALTASVDLPVLADTIIALAAAPSNGGTLPASVTIPAGQTSATFNFVDTATSGNVVITATLGASTSTSTLSVSNAPSHLVISQIYGGGGNTGAQFKNDFIELHNPGSAPLPLNGMSVQYTSATGAGTWLATPLPDVMIPAGGYYLIAEAAGTGNAPALPSPDLTVTMTPIAMSGTQGKVALVANATPLAGMCPTAGVVDKIGYGVADCFEGMPTAVLTNTTAAARNGSGCIDTDNNKNDFTLGPPAPRNGGTTALTCP